jgi:hypothetical protein
MKKGVVLPQGECSLLCHFAEYSLHIYGQCQASGGLLTVAKIDHGSIRSAVPTLTHLSASWVMVPALGAVVANCLMACDAHRLGILLQHLAAA